MRGNLIIGKNQAFYNINNNLIKVNINGNFNKVVNPFRIKNLYIQGNNNIVEVVENGEINFIKIFGNNNKIFLKNNSESNYYDQGVGNEMKKIFIPQNRIRFRQQLRNNRNRINYINQNNNSFYNRNRINNFLNELEEHSYSEVPFIYKMDNFNKCFLCNQQFINHEKVRIFTCRKHIFHSNCLKEWIKSHINSPLCPKCNELNNFNINIQANPFIPRNIILNIPLNLGLRFHRDDEDDNYEDEEPNDDFDDYNDDEENIFHDEIGFDDENFDDDDDFDLMPKIGLNKEILDNMEISKIKNVEKLDNDKKKCTICLEDYVNGDDSIALPCIHIFHANCIKTWLKNQNTCPICKYEIKYGIEDIENDDI